MTENTPTPAEHHTYQEAVIEEYHRAIAKGHDAAHDDKHGREHLIRWAMHYAGEGEAIKASALLLAVAAFDGRNGKPADLTAERDARVLRDAAARMVTPSDEWFLRAEADRIEREARS